MRASFIGTASAVALLAGAALAGCSQTNMPQRSGSSSGTAAPIGSAYDRSGGPVTGSTSNSASGATTGTSDVGGRMGNRTDVDNTPNNARATPRQ